MPLLDIRQRTGYLFVAVTIAHIILISAQVNTNRGVPVLEAVTVGAFAEVQRGASAAIGGIRDSWQEYFALRSVRAENERLRHELAALQIRLQQEEALAAQTRSLQALLDLKSSVALSTAAASVIASGASPAFRTVTIDRGTNAGIRPDMAVLSSAGVVGRVITPSQRAAKVQLLIDRNAAAGVIDERSRAQGLVVGTGAATLRMEYVSGTADLQVGDSIVTSGIDRIYPKGFVIGRIESIERSAGEFTSIVVRPVVDFSSIENVLVVLSPIAADDGTDDPAGRSQAPE